MRVELVVLQGLQRDAEVDDLEEPLKRNAHLVAADAVEGLDKQEAARRNAPSLDGAEERAEHAFDRVLALESRDAEVLVGVHIESQTLALGVVFGKLELSPDAVA